MKKKKQKKKLCLYKLEQVFLFTAFNSLIGFNDAILQSAIIKQFFMFLRERHSIDVKVAPITFSKLMAKVITYLILKVLAYYTFVEF